MTISTWPKRVQPFFLKHGGHIGWPSKNNVDLLQRHDYSPLEYQTASGRNVMQKLGILEKCGKVAKHHNNSSNTSEYETASCRKPYAKARYA